jgi:hypothetical protein
MNERLHEINLHVANCVNNPVYSKWKKIVCLALFGYLGVIYDIKGQRCPHRRRRRWCPSTTHDRRLWATSHPPSVSDSPTLHPGWPLLAAKTKWTASCGMCFSQRSLFVVMFCLPGLRPHFSFMGLVHEKPLPGIHGPAVLGARLFDTVATPIPVLGLISYLLPRNKQYDE